MLPGRVNEDGTLNQASVSATTPALILSGCARRETAFSFIRWFASAKIQTSYGLAVENVLGVGARYTPANLEALESLNWTADELAVLKSQMDQSAFMEQIPATYYVTRCLTNAYRAVTVSGKNAREALYSYNIDINNEITRKRQELGLE